MPGKLLIQSAKRDTTLSTSSTDFVISNITPPIDLRNKTHVRLCYAKIPNTVYNVNVHNNNLDVVEGKINYLAAVSAGAYDVNSFAAALQASLNAASASAGGGNTYTVTYNSATMRYTIAASTNNFTLLFATGTNSQSSMYRILGGFSPAGVPLDISSGTKVITFAAVANLYPTLSFLIQIGEFLADTHQAVSIADNTGSNLPAWRLPNFPSGEGCVSLFLVENNGVSGSILPSYRGIDARPEIATLPKASWFLQNLHVRLIDTNTCQVAILNGADWEFEVDFL